MQVTLSSELSWLTLVVVFTSLMWVPYIINRMAELGIVPALWDPFGHTEAKAAWANRMMRAHENALENLIIFASLVLTLQISVHSTDLTANACMIYFVARLVHFIGFTFRVPLVRVVSFLVGFASQMVLALTLLQVI